MEKQRLGSKRPVVFIVAVILLLTVVAALMIACIVGRQEELCITPQTITTVNDNNYIFDNDVDYKGNRLAWAQTGLWGTKVKIYDDQGNCETLTGVSAPFQLLDHQIVFISRNTLQIKDIPTKQVTKIADGVDKFMVCQDHIFYSSVSVFNDEIGQWTNTLCAYSVSSQDSKVLYNNISQFYVYKEKLFVVNEDDWLVEISWKDGTAENRIHFQVEKRPFYVMPQGNHVLYVQANRLNIVDLDSGNVQSVSIVDSSYANNKIHYICDDHKVFVSFQATRTNGSVVTNISDEHNGVWVIDPQTLEKEKICSDVFERLYLFNGDWLIGVKNKSLYKIDSQTKQVVKITE